MGMAKVGLKMKKYGLIGDILEKELEPKASTK